MYSIPSVRIAQIQHSHLPRKKLHHHSAAQHIKHTRMHSTSSARAVQRTREPTGHNEKIIHTASPSQKKHHARTPRICPPKHVQCTEIKNRVHNGWSISAIHSTSSTRTVLSTLPKYTHPVQMISALPSAAHIWNSSRLCGQSSKPLCSCCSRPASWAIATWHTP